MDPSGHIAIDEKQYFGKCFEQQQLSAGKYFLLYGGLPRVSVDFFSPGAVRQAFRWHFAGFQGLCLGHSDRNLLDESPYIWAVGASLVITYRLVPLTSWLVPLGW